MFVPVVVLLATLGGSLAQVMTNQSCVGQPCILGTSFVDIALVIDTSTSISRAYFQAIQEFINLWASDYAIGAATNQVQFGFVTYGLWAASYGTFSTASASIATLNSVVEDLAYQNHPDRNLFDALTKVQNNLITGDSNSGWRENSKHLMVVFSGDSFTGPDYKTVAANLRTKFDKVVAVGLTQNAVTKQYLDLVELVGGDASNVFLIGGASGLKYIIPWLEFQACGVSSSGGSTPAGGATTTQSPGTTTAQQYYTCNDYYNMGQRTSGVYPINIGGTVTNVPCDMDSMGGWTVIQSRVDGSINFDVSYDVYRSPLGVAKYPFSDFWLGNENIHTLTNTYSLQLRVRTTDCDGTIQTARYTNFTIDGHDNLYTLHTNAMTDDSTATDAFNIVRFGATDQGRPFSTRATYNPAAVNGPSIGQKPADCKSLLYGGWWFGSCVPNLNGKWYAVNKPLCVDSIFPDGIRWSQGGNFSLPKTVMEVLPNSVTLY